MIIESLNFPCQWSLCSSGPTPTTNRRHNLSSVALISFHQQTDWSDSSQICPSRWHKERRKEARKDNKETGDEWDWEAKSFLKVPFFLCGVCQSEKETVEKALLLIIHIIIAVIVIAYIILQIWKSEADVNFVERVSVLKSKNQRVWSRTVL